MSRLADALCRARPVSDCLGLSRLSLVIEKLVFCRHTLSSTKLDYAKVKQSRRALIERVFAAITIGSIVRPAGRLYMRCASAFSVFSLCDKAIEFHKGALAETF